MDMDSGGHRHPNAYPAVGAARSQERRNLVFALLLFLLLTGTFVLLSLLGR